MDSSKGSRFRSASSSFTLRGSDWSSGRVNAYFALQIIAVLVFIACLVLATRFKWVRKAGTDKLRHTGYILATLCALIYYLLQITITAMTEARTVVTNLFFIVDIVSSFFWRISDIMILSIILRTLYESSASKIVGRLPAINAVFTTILTLVSMAAFSINTAYTATALILMFSDSWSRRDIFSPMYGGYVDFAYNILYVIATVIVVVYSVCIFVKDRSKATTLMTGVVAPALFFRNFFSLVATGLFTFPISIKNPRQYDSYVAFPWASYFISLLMAYAIFLGVAFIGCIKPRYPDFLLEQKPTPSPDDQNDLPGDYTHNGGPQSYHGNTPVYSNTEAPTVYPNGTTGFNGPPATAHTQPHIV